MHYIIAHAGFFIYCEGRALHLGGRCSARFCFLGGSALRERTHGEKDWNEEDRWQSIIGKENGPCCFCGPVL